MDANEHSKNYKPRRPQPIVLDDHVSFDDIFDLPRLGSGHDGYVFKYGNLALKLLKYDIPTRRERNLMTFKKAQFFKNELDLRRMLKPEGVFFDEEGQYAGYYMPAIDNLANPKSPNYRSPSSYSTEDLLYAIYDLESDRDELTRKNVVMKDLNRGAYLFDSEFMKICDMDKFYRALSRTGVHSLNIQGLNFLIAKFFLYEIQSKKDITDGQKKAVLRWVKSCINDIHFISRTKDELFETPNATIGDYLDEKCKILL